MSVASSAVLLLVDDDPQMLRLLDKLIARALLDLRIEMVADPEAAFARIERGDVDILLTDLEMPGTSGLNLLRAAKRRNARTQVVLLTGHSSSTALLDALEYGCSDYLLKPIDRDELITVLRQAHERHQRWQRSMLETLRQHGSAGLATATPS